MKIVITSNSGIQHKYLWERIIKTGHEVFVLAQTHLSSNSISPPVNLFSRGIALMKRYSKRTLVQLKEKRMLSLIKKQEDFELNRFFHYDHSAIQAFNRSGNYHEFPQ